MPVSLWRSLHDVNMRLVLFLMIVFGSVSMDGRTMDDHSYYTRTRVGDVMPMSHYTGKRLPNGDNPPVTVGRSVNIETGALGEVFEIPLGVIVQDIDDGMAIATNFGSKQSELLWLTLPE